MNTNNKSTQKNIAVALVKNAEGKILIVKRRMREDSIDGVLSWAFPGDNFTQGQDPKQVIKDYVLSETGYKVTPTVKISERVYHPFGYHLEYYEAELNNEFPTDKHQMNTIDGIAWVYPKLVTEYFTTNIDKGVARYLGLRSL